MSNYVVNVSSGSSDLRAQTIDSSTQPGTVASSLPGYAFPVIDLAAQDSPSHTVEYIASSPRPSSSVSSEEFDVDIARARAVELQLASEEAEQARRAAAAKREAAAAHRRLLEAKARSSRTSRASGSSRNDRGRSIANEPTGGDDGGRRQNIGSAQGLRPVSLDQHGAADDLDHGHRRPSLPERSRPIPGAGVLDFLFSDAEVVADAVQGHQPSEELRRQAPHQPANDIDEQLKALQRRIAELEAEKGGNDDKEAGGSGMRPTASSGFQTPRTIIDAPLIDLSSPPKAQYSHKSGEDSLMDMMIPEVEPPPGLGHGLDAGTKGKVSRNVITEQADHDTSSSSSSSPSESEEEIPVKMNEKKKKDKKKKKNAARDDHDPPPPSSPSSSESEELPEKKPKKKELAVSLVKSKEPDTIRLAALPKVENFDAWKAQVRSRIRAAAGGNDQAFLWILDVEDPKVMYDDLSDPGDFRSLDAKLGAAISDLVIGKGELERLMTLKTQEAAKLKTYLSGRQQLRLIYDRYKLDEENGKLFEIEDIMSLTFPGDEHLEMFKQTWDDMLSMLEEDPGEGFKRGLMHKLVRSSAKLSREISIFETARKGSYEKSYAYLYNVLHRKVEHERLESNRSALVRARQIRAQPKRMALPSQEVEGGDINSSPADPPAPALPNREKKKGPCFAWRNGTCKHGDNCQWRHDGQAGQKKDLTDAEKKEIAAKRAKMPCHGFAAGHCRFGDKCQYSHAEGPKSSSAGVCTAVGGSDDDENVLVFTAPALNQEDDEQPAEQRDEVAAPARSIKEWIIDTGTENHLIGADKCCEEEDDIRDVERPLRLATANGEIVADKRVAKKVGALDTTIDPLILDRTIDAISVGRLVLENGFSFHWPSGGDAYLVDKMGRRTPCETKGYVPVLRHDPGEPDLMCGPCAAPGVENRPGDQEAGQEGGGEQAEAGNAADQDAEEEVIDGDGKIPASHYLTHRPKRADCWACTLSKMTAKPARKVDPSERRLNPKAFGEHVCADHVVLHNAKSMGMNGERAALFIMDMFTRVPDLVPVKDKSAEETVRAIRYYMGDAALGRLYTDNSKELIAAGRELDTIHQTATPHRPQTNAFAERGIRTMLEGARTALLQAGLPPRFWPLAARHHSFATAICEQPNGDASPYFLKHSKDFEGWKLPFGCLVHFRPPRPIAQELPKFAPRAVPGIFLGWHVEPGCNFRGDYLVIPIATFQAPDQKSYHAYRVKELVSFEPTQFPLQVALIEEMTKVKAPEKVGDVQWPDEAATEDKVDESGVFDRPSIDFRYKDLFGEFPPDDWTQEQKWDKVALELFGEDNEDEMWEPEKLLALEDSGEGADVGDEPMAIEDGGERAEGDDGTEGHDLEGSPAEDASSHTQSRAPRGKKIHLPKKITFAASPARSGTPAFGHEERDKAYSKFVRSESTPSCPAKRRKITPISDRRIVEFCCGADSLIGRSKYRAIGCAVYRMTIHNDLTTQAGMDAAMNAVNAAKENEYVHLWASLPCTAGSPWQNLNRKHPGAAERMEEHMKVFHSLFDNFEKVAEQVFKRGGDVTFEWPTGCGLWREKKVQNMLQRFSLNAVDFHGCAAGLTSVKNQLPIKKPWTVMSSSPAVLEYLGRFQCPGKKVHPKHDPCAGVDTKRSEGYTPAMADAIHEAVREESLSFRAMRAMAATQVVKAEPDEVEEEHSNDEYAGDDAPSVIDENGHRPKSGPEPMWCTMVTKTLSPKDPLRHHPKAKVALAEELADLRSVPTWDEDNVMEASEAARRHPDAHFARLFAIIGIKNFEQADESQHKWKGRVVLSGDAIKTATGDWAMFAEVGNVPSTMSACRAMLATYCLEDDMVLLQSDCVRAYVQAPMQGPPTFVRLPRAWWPAGWSSFRDPVCRLLRALYGHPHSGDFWHEKLKAQLLVLEFTTIEGWPSVFKLTLGEQHVIIFIVYVDDLLMLGTERMHHIIRELRKTIKMEDPQEMGKYLGCLHHIAKHEAQGELITEIAFDMRQYFRSAVEQFVEVTGVKLHPVASPYAPRLAANELDRLMAMKGELAEHAASFLMKLMYGTRMAMPSLSVVISRLASQITKWTAESDRRLIRVYSYLCGALDMTLTGSLAKSDKSKVRLTAWPDADLNGCHLTTKSTSGFFLELAGADGRGLPLSWGSKKQGATALHTAEAEMVSLASCLRSEAIPMQTLLQHFLRRPIDLDVMEDNAATIVAASRGYSPAMRHLTRSQRTSLGFVHDMISQKPNPGEGSISIVKADTKEHRGDMFTKELEPKAFDHALRMIRMERRP